MFVTKYLGSAACRGLWGIQHTHGPTTNLVDAVGRMKKDEDLPLVQLHVSSKGETASGRQASSHSTDKSQGPQTTFRVGCKTWFQARSTPGDCDWMGPTVWVRLHQHRAGRHTDNATGWYHVNFPPSSSCDQIHFHPVCVFPHPVAIRFTSIQFVLHVNCIDSLQEDVDVTKERKK